MPARRAIGPARGATPPVAALIGGFRDHLAARTPTDAEIRLHLPRALVDPAVEFACAWLGGEAVGYAQMSFWTSVWAPGTETQLELSRAAARGALRFGLNTNERNDVAQRLYRSEGLSPQSHALYPGGREVFWVKYLESG